MRPEFLPRAKVRPLIEQVKVVVGQDLAIADLGHGDILWIMPVFATFVTSEGTFKARLLDQEAPKTVENFVGLAEGTKDWTDPRNNRKVRQPYYDGVIFHRVIDGFMIQGGDPLGQGIGGPGYTF